MSETVLNQAPVPEAPASPPAEAKKDSALWREIKGIFWVLVAVLLGLKLRDAFLKKLPAAMGRR